MASGAQSKTGQKSGDPHLSGVALLAELLREHERGVLHVHVHHALVRAARRAEGEHCGHGVHELGARERRKVLAAQQAQDVTDEDERGGENALAQRLCHHHRDAALRHKVRLHLHAPDAPVTTHTTPDSARRGKA